MREIGDGKELHEKFKKLDERELYFLKQELGKQRKNEKEFREYINHKVSDYIDMKKKRL